MESLEERIATTELIALKENQSVPLQDVPPLPRGPPPNSLPPPERVL